MSSDNSPLKHYFIYYRIRDGADIDDAHASVRAMQLALGKKTGIVGRLFVRDHEETTWMEVYEGVSGTIAFELALREGVEQHDLESIIQPGSARHMECFLECV
ncbi:MAG: DUF4936 family protein [Azoarcus sp.]|jgi:hypothetical protein|nr:DUF4936 family protein [Azoarcus sp.]MDD2875288.1 DUF4936 family protein [Azoarcus sp.]MDX9836123.1 DUF4936 family protein [Azoarcus sp.]